MTLGRLKQFQDAATAYQNSRSVDDAAQLGVGASIILVYFAVVYEQPLTLVACGIGLFSAFLFWKLRRGPMTAARMNEIAIAGFMVATVVSGYWYFAFQGGKSNSIYLYVLAIIEVGYFVATGVWILNAARRLRSTLSIGQEEFDAVRAEVERAERDGRKQADAITSSFPNGTKLWFVRPFEEFACVIRLDMFRGDTLTFERVSVVPISERAIKEKLIEFGGAKAVATVLAKLDWPHQTPSN